MWKFFLPLLILFGASLLVLSSVNPVLFHIDIAWVGLSLLLISTLFFFRGERFFNHPWVVWGLYALSCVLLLLTLFIAPVIRHVKSWLVFGSLTFQPVELAKIALILLFAHYFSRRHLTIARWKTIINSFFLMAIPAGITAVQPDLGSASVLFVIWASFLLFSGLPKNRVFVAILVLGTVAFFGWHFVLKEYQRERIVGVLYPERDVLGINYSVAQAKIAIGSAGFWGKGYGQGSQTQLGFISVPEGDFILPALIEEWGLFGGLIVLAALGWLVMNILRVSLRATQNVEKLLCLGAAALFTVQFAVNAGSAIGLFPVVGVTFPFLSYGGSSLLMNSLIFGIISSIACHS